MLVYCVCSLEPEEGEEQAAWITATLPDLEAVPISAGEIDGYPEAILRAGVVRSHPAIPLGVSGGKPGTMDGFFVARFRRR